MTYDDLTAAQKHLHDTVSEASRVHGRDLKELLMLAIAKPADKAAVAEVWGGSGAGAEFLR
jgi:hypothetical protein